MKKIYSIILGFDLSNLARQFKLLADAIAHYAEKVGDTPPPPPRLFFFNILDQLSFVNF